MADIEIYTSPLCAYCWRAKTLLDDMGAAYTEHDVTTEPGAREKMTARAGGRTSVPQIFIGGEGVGGSDDLARLKASGELDALIAAANADAGGGAGA